jgi:type II secretory pathway predicted ATPase ExeA
MNRDAHIDSATEIRIKEFDDRLIAHPTLDSVFRETQIAWKRPDDGGLVTILGPTGAGKSTVTKKSYREIIRENVDSMRADPGLIPVVLVEVPAPENGSFHWGLYYRTFLDAFMEPMANRKSLEVVDRELREELKNGATFVQLRRAVEHCIKHRGTKVVIIDEAQHFTKVPNARRLLDQLDTIKSLASASGALFIMVGTYDLMHLLDRNGQLARRTQRIHFPRYDYTKSPDRLAFRNIVAMFQSRLPIPSAVNLVDHLDFAYMGCIGCIGTLKGWLRRSVGRAVETGGASLTLDHLRASILGNDSLLAIAEEIRTGESLFAAARNKESELRNVLGLPGREAALQPVGTDSKRVSKRAVGERAPGRDPIRVAI